jgi:gliding motility-associated-like protein
MLAVMRKLLVSGLFLTVSIFIYAQDLSNKGKEFWLGYGNHQQMYAGNTQGMSVYITSDVNTNALVEIPGLGFSQSVAVTAFQIATVNIPNNAILDAEGKVNKGIHVKADKAVVVYAHIYFASVSGATLCLPVATLGKEYYSVNFKQVAQSNVNANSYSYFFVTATEDNTTVEITPSATTLSGRPANVPFTDILNKGEVYQILANSDLTGSTIKSINTGSGCKKIAVFCGSGRIGIGCPNGSAGVSSSDNLFQQMYPTSTWGKKYITVPSANRPRNYYRIVSPNPATANVRLNGAPVPAIAFTNGFYYEFEGTTTNLIEADEPILVSQYFTTQQCGEATSNGDPEMIYLNPVEQTISDVTLTSMRLINTGNNVHYINVVVKNVAGALNSIKLDGAFIGSGFIPLPQDPSYAYSQLTVSLGTHRIVCDSGFNAIAYGFANTESYGYSAGTNLKDLYQYVTVDNQYAIVNFPAGCKNSPLKFSMTFPYQPTQIQWIFNGLIPDTTVTAPVYDSTWIVNGRTLYRYKLKKSYTVATSGTYPIKVVATNPTADGCTGEQEIDYDLQIFDPPVASFTFTNNGCITSPVLFQDATNIPQPRKLIIWYWNFGDGQTATIKNPSHLYSAGGAFPVKFTVITDVGCLSDTITGIVNISDPPVAKFIVQGVSCEKKAVTFVDQSTVTTGSIAKWYWDFGDGTTLIAANSNSVLHTYTTTGSYNVTLQVETSSSCKSLIYTFPVVINPNPLVDFSLPSICLPAGNGQFNDLSTIADGSQASFTYAWDFGDGQSSTQKNPVNVYSGAGPYNVKLIVTSNKGCTDDSVKMINTIYPQPIADFTVTAEVCLGAATTFTDKSDGKGSAVTQWQWDFGDGQTSTQQSPVHSYTIANNYNVSLTITTDKGCISSVAAKPTIVNALPAANFITSAPVCETKQVTFTDASAANSGTLVKWNWNFGDGTTGIVQSPAHNYTLPNTYNVSLNVETNKGCKSTIITNAVKVNYLPKTNFLTPDICLNDPIAQFFDSSFIADNTESQFSYLWDFGDGASSVQKDGQHKYAAVGVYNVKLSVTSKDGCVKDTAKLFTVNGSLPLANFTVNSATELCSNKEVSIADAATVDFGKIIKVEVYWDYLNDPTIKTTDNNPAAGKIYTYKYPDAGTTSNKQIRYVVYSGITCLNQSARTITLQASPQIQFDPMQAVCEEIPAFVITDAKEINGLTGTGTYSGPGISATGIFDPLAARPGQHTITYKYVTDNGCETEKTQTILVNPTPIVDAGPDRVLLEGGYIIIDTKITGNNLSYLWTPATFLDNDNIAKPKVTTKEDITYSLLVTSADGCKATDDISVKILKQIKVPNAFSPNGDGINDTWEILYLESYPGCVIDVYNRYGQVVFHSIGYARAWDGRMNGLPLPFGTYYWIINPKNGRQQVNGSVTIIR